MPFPDINPLVETFLEPTRILLFGKRFPTLVYAPEPMADAVQVAEGEVQQEFEPYLAPEPGGVEGGAQPPLPMPPSVVEQALRQTGADGVFARIYGFSYEGHYYKLPRPLLFLVRGEGARSRQPEGPVNEGVRTFNTRFTGVEGKDWQFGEDILVWAVDRHDVAICLDVEIGSYHEVLLQSLGSRQEDPFGSSANSRNAAYFRTRVAGFHQDR